MLVYLPSSNASKNPGQLAARESLANQLGLEERVNEPLLLTLVKAAQEAETKLLSSPSPARASNAALVAEARAKFNFYDEVRILVIYICVCAFVCAVVCVCV